MPAAFHTIAHEELSSGNVSLMRALFDHEYSGTYGDWDPDQPYGYAPADFHVIAVDEGRLLGHVGFQRREILVGGVDVAVAGTGGVLVEEDARGSGLGRRLMRRAQQAMLDIGGIRFGYLGCRPAVVPFYESAGWRRVHARERHSDRLDHAKTVVDDRTPILISSVLSEVDSWPAGDIDLRGAPW